MVILFVKASGLSLCISIVWEEAEPKTSGMLDNRSTTIELQPQLLMYI